MKTFIKLGAATPKPGSDPCSGANSRPPLCNHHWLWSAESASIFAAMSV